MNNDNNVNIKQIPPKPIQEKVCNRVIDVMEKGGRFTKDIMINLMLNDENLKDITPDFITMIVDRYWNVMENNYLIKKIEGTKYYRTLTPKEMQDAIDFAKKGD